MNYDEDLLVELIACGDVSQTEIAEKVGVSRRTVWRIANGQSRPDLQQKIADTVEGYRQATIRMAAKWMEPLLKKQIKIALEGNDETARKCREFLLKTFMITLPERTAKTAAKKRDPAVAPRLEGAALYNRLFELSPDLKNKVVEELGGPSGERISTTKDSQGTEVQEATATTTACLTTDDTDDTDVETAKATDKPVSEHGGKETKEVPAPFSTKVTLPNGKKVYAESIRLIEEAQAEAEKIKPRRRVPRSPNRYHYP